MLRAVPPILTDGRLPWLVCLLLAVGMVVLWLVMVRRNGTASRASRRRNRVAQQGEADAEALLASYGYRVIDRQVRALWWMVVDGEEREVEVRADLLVEDSESPGRQLVAEVKTGTMAPDPTWPATRRQLLEYSLVFAPMGVLLVDLERGEVVEVAFNPPAHD
jgi:hypothetical protein